MRVRKRLSNGVLHRSQTGATQVAETLRLRVALVAEVCRVSITREDASLECVRTYASETWRTFADGVHVYMEACAAERGCAAHAT